MHLTYAIWILNIINNNHDDNNYNNILRDELTCAYECDDVTYANKKYVFQCWYTLERGYVLESDRERIYPVSLF